MKPLSQDLRERVIAALEAGDATQQQIAERFAVSLSWVKKIHARQRETGSAAARPHGGGPVPKLTPAHRQRLAELLGEQADATLAELKERSGAPVSLGRLSRVLSEMGLGRKKKVCTPPSATASPSSKRAGTGATSTSRKRRPSST